MKGVSVLSKERVTDYISKQKIYNYIKAQINPYGKPFDGTAYEFGLKIMDYIKNSSCDEDLEELKQYRDLEEQGLLLRIPVAVGDTLYKPIWGHILVYKVLGVSFEVSRFKLFQNGVLEKVYTDYSKIPFSECLNEQCNFDRIGKTVFLTQAEAEEKLRELEEKYNEK